MKIRNACNPILDTFRTISRCGTKVQSARIVIIIVIKRRVIAHHLSLMTYRPLASARQIIPVDVQRPDAVIELDRASLTVYDLVFD